MNRRRFLAHGAAATAASVAFLKPAASAAPRFASSEDDDHLLGQGDYRYRLDRYWGELDREQVPVNDCHAITEDREGRIVLLTNDTYNNLIYYTRDGEFVSKREDRFPKAHALEFLDDGSGDELSWITDHGISVVSLCTADGRELRRITPDAVASVYPDLSKYHPTNVAVMPDGDFYVSDGYGSHYIHHFDPDWKYISTFGGAGEGDEHLKQPHSVWLDTRRGKNELLVCDRANQRLKWFSPAGELLRIVPLPGSLPSNVVQFEGNHLAIASLNGFILILDGEDRVVSVVGGEPPKYVNGELQQLVAYNYAFNFPHDVYADAAGDLYVAQWNSRRTYPMKLERVRA